MRLFFKQELLHRRVAPLFVELEDIRALGAVDEAVPDVPQVLDGLLDVQLHALGPELPQGKVKLVQAGGSG